MRSRLVVRATAVLFAAVAVAGIVGCSTGGGGSTTSGEDAASTTSTASAGGGAVFELVSSAFASGGVIPERFALHPHGSSASEASIPYEWSGAPAGTRSFALSLVDHAPVAHEWVHWLVIDLPPQASALPEGASHSASMPSGSRELVNSFGSVGYGGPMPPPGSGVHPYEATIYALDEPSLALPAHPSLAQFEQAIAGHVLGQASYTGTFQR